MINNLYYDHLKLLNPQKVIIELEEDAGILQDIELATLALAYAMLDESNKLTRIKAVKDKLVSDSAKAIFEEGILISEWNKPDVDKVALIARAEAIYSSYKDAIFAGNLLAKGLIELDEVHKGMAVFDALILQNPNLDWLRHSRYQSLVRPGYYSLSSNYVDGITDKFAATCYQIISRLYSLRPQLIFLSLMILFLLPNLNHILFGVISLTIFGSFTVSRKKKNKFLSSFFLGLFPRILFIYLSSLFIINMFF